MEGIQLPSSLQSLTLGLQSLDDLQLQIPAGHTRVVHLTVSRSRWQLDANLADSPAFAAMSAGPAGGGLQLALAAFWRQDLHGAFLLPSYPWPLHHAAQAM